MKQHIYVKLRAHCKGRLICIEENRAKFEKELIINRMRIRALKFSEILKRRKLNLEEKALKKILKDYTSEENNLNKLVNNLTQLIDNLDSKNSSKTERESPSKMEVILEDRSNLELIKSAAKMINKGLRLDSALDDDQELKICYSSLSVQNILSLIKEYKSSDDDKLNEQEDDSKIVNKIKSEDTTEAVINDYSDSEPELIQLLLNASNEIEKTESELNFDHEMEYASNTNDLPDYIDGIYEESYDEVYEGDEEDIK